VERRLFPAAAVAWLVCRTGGLARRSLGRRAFRNPLDVAAAACAYRTAVTDGRPARGHRAEPAGLEPADRRAGVRHMIAWVWLLVPFAPLLVNVALLWLRGRALPWLWLACAPALLVAMLAPPALELPWLWEGVRWGADDTLTRAWLGFSAVL